MKRMIAAMLCAAVLFELCGIAASAVKKDKNPIILISGFMCSNLFVDYGTPVQEKVWPPDVSKITGIIKNDISDLAPALFGLVFGETEHFGKVLGDGMADVLEKLRLNPDGSSVYPVTHYINDPRYSTVEYMRKNCPENIYEKKFSNYIADAHNPSEVFVFQYDSRLDAVTVAQEFRSFVDAVREYTGAEKVNVFALSYGGLIVSTYLTLYGEENALKRIVMSVPALGGTALPDSLLRCKTDFDLQTTVRFFETVLSGESDFARLFEGRSADVVNSIANALCSVAMEKVVYWGSLWSLCSPQFYDELKNDYLETEANAELTEKTDFVQYKVRTELKQTFEKCRSQGMSISILCASGSPLVTGGGFNGDFILPASGVSGAVCAPLGSRFSDGYKAVGTSCNDPGHNHVSPSMEIDASSCYLPENTWFIDGQYHGQYYYEKYTRNLVTKLLLTDEIADIYSDPRYPQFELSQHSYRTLHAAFNRSPSGYLSADDTALTVTNLSESNYIKVFSVVPYGVELEFKALGSGLLAPGESTEIVFSDKLPRNMTVAALTVGYVEIGSFNPFCTRNFDFTVNNGKVAGLSDGLTVNSFESKLEEAVPEWFYNLLVRLSLRPAAEFVYNAVVSAVK